MRCGGSDNRSYKPLQNIPHRVVFFFQTQPLCILRVRCRSLQSACVMMLFQVRTSAVRAPILIALGIVVIASVMPATAALCISPGDHTRTESLFDSCCTAEAAAPHDPKSGDKLLSVRQPEHGDCVDCVDLLMRQTAVQHKRLVITVFDQGHCDGTHDALSALIPAPVRSTWPRQLLPSPHLEQTATTVLLT